MKRYLKMKNSVIKATILMVVLQLFGLLFKVECRPEAKKGQGKAFGTGLLAGGLAGAAVTHFLTKQNAPTEIHHHHHMVDANSGPANAVVANPASVSNTVPLPRPSTIIDRGETLSNGCYKQTIKEADVHDVTKFIETEQLICPQNVLPPTYEQQVPVISVPSQPVVPPQPAQPVVPAAPSMQPISVSVPQITSASEQVNSTSIVPIPPNLQVPEQRVYLVPDLPVVPMQPSNPLIPKPSVTPQVFVLSKKSGFYEDDKKKKSAANSLFSIRFDFLLLIALAVHMS